MGEPNYVTMGEIAAREVATLTPGLRPQNPELGWLYVDKNDSHLYYFDGKDWKQVDGGGPNGTQGPPIFGSISDKQIGFGVGDDLGGSNALQWDSDSQVMTVAGVTNTMAILFMPIDPTKRDTVPEGAMYYSATEHKLYLNTDLGWVALN